MLKQNLRNVLLLMMFSTGLSSCSLATEMIAPVANFGLGVYNADTYYSKECAWYEEIHFSDKTRAWIRQAKPDRLVLEDFAKVARNNDIFKEVCDDRDE